MSRPFQLVSCLALLTAGCIESTNNAESKKEDKGIFGKKTQEIGVFDRNKANQVVSDHAVNARDPITGPLAIYRSQAERISIIAVDQALGFFNATEGRYPASHEEFMEKIIKANNIQLPVLPYKGQYMYDVENHELKVVRDLENAEKAK